MRTFLTDNAFSWVFGGMIFRFGLHLRRLPHHASVLRRSLRIQWKSTDNKITAGVAILVIVILRENKRLT